MLANLKTFYDSRELLWVWTRRELKVRYKQSLLGAAWAILQPLAMMVVFSIVFSFFARIPTGEVPYPLFSYAALLPWTFFATSITFAVPSLIKNMSLVTKMNFPREILPTAAIMAAFADFLVASVAFVGLMFYYRLPLHPSVLWVPLLLMVQIGLTLGVALPASALIVWYRDVRFVVPLALQVLLYTSPIIYPISLVPERLRTIYMLNPMATLIDSYRRVVIKGQAPHVVYLTISAGVALVLLVGGYAYFKRSEAQFADII